jgi:hypothetical protein
MADPAKGNGSGDCLHTLTRVAGRRKKLGGTHSYAYNASMLPMLSSTLCLRVEGLITVDIHGSFRPFRNKTGISISDASIDQPRGLRSQALISHFLLSCIYMPEPQDASGATSSINNDIWVKTFVATNGASVHGKLLFK